MYNKNLKQISEPIKLDDLKKMAETLTLQDIALFFGCSINTVARVLKENNIVKKDMRLNANKQKNNLKKFNLVKKED